MFQERAPAPAAGHWFCSARWVLCGAARCGRWFLAVGYPYYLQSLCRLGRPRAIGCRSERFAANHLGGVWDARLA
jgi:hypothetical protein